MKIRRGFVSNSSSSSFIVYDKSDTMIEQHIPENMVYYTEDWVAPSMNDHFDFKLVPTINLPCELGKTEFGWDFERRHDIVTRLNWCAVQLLFAKKRDLYCNYKDQHIAWYDMVRNFKDVVYRELGYNVRFDYNSIEDDGVDGGYANIDHQSAAYEDLSIAAFFLDKEAIKAFLCGEHSYYQGGNDNCDPTEEWLESCKKMDPESYEEYIEEVGNEN